MFKFWLLIIVLVGGLSFLTTGLSAKTKDPSQVCIALGDTASKSAVSVTGEFTRSLSQAQSSALRRCTDLGYLKCRIKSCKP